MKKAGGNLMYEVGNTVHRLNRDEKKEEFANMLIREAESVDALLRETLLRCFVAGEEDYKELFDAYREISDMDYSAHMRMIIVKPEGEHRGSELHFLKKRIESAALGRGIVLNSVLKDHILVITDNLEKSWVLSLTEKIRLTVRKHGGCDIMAVYSDIVTFSDLPEKYAKLQACLDGLFYAGNSRILYENDISERHFFEEQPDYETFEAYIKDGDASSAKSFLNDYFGLIERARPSSDVAKERCAGLYASLLRCCSVQKLDAYLKGEEELRRADSFGAVKRIIHEASDEIASENKPKNTKIYSSLIKDTIETIDKNIENENLSLRWLAGTILYTNVDYLGKLFKKETGKNFSHYVMEKRMEMAKELILEGKKDRIYEVAEKVGYGSNSQYFSQVFKKYTGVSPLEYKEFARLMRQKN